MRCRACDTGRPQPPGPACRCRPRLRAAEERARQLEAELASRDEELAAGLGALQAEHEALRGECQRWRAAAAAAAAGGDGGGDE